MKILKKLYFVIVLLLMAEIVFAASCQLPESNNIGVLKNYINSVRDTTDEKCLVNIDFSIIGRLNQKTETANQYEQLYFSFHKKFPEINSELFADYISAKFMGNTKDYLFVLDSPKLIMLLGYGIESSYIANHKDKQTINNYLNKIPKKNQLTMQQTKGLSKLIKIINSMEIDANYVVCARDGYVNLRHLPNTQATVLKKLKNGFSILGQSVTPEGDWYKVRLRDQQELIEGYIHKSGLQNNNKCGL